MSDDQLDHLLVYRLKRTSMQNYFSAMSNEHLQVEGSNANLLFKEDLDEFICHRKHLEWLK